MYNNQVIDNDFRVGNMSTELLEYTLDICNKDENKRPRFPERLYSSYVHEMISLSVGILEDVFFANAIRYKPVQRIEKKEQALGKLTALAKLIFIAFKKGWISDEQHTAWQKKVVPLYYIILRW